MRSAVEAGAVNAAGTVPECIDASGRPVACTVNIAYFGGDALSNVKVYAVFWTGAVSAEILLGMGEFYRTLTDSAWIDWMTEYSTNIPIQAGSDQGQPGTGQIIGRGTFAGSYTLTVFSRTFPSCPAPDQALTCVSDALVAEELDWQAGNGHLPPPDANTLYMVHFPANVRISDPGDVSCQQYCAYHSTFLNAAHQDVNYGVIPDQGANGCQNGCGTGTTFQNTCSTASHEVAESITDAQVGLVNKIDFPLGWYDNERVSQGEIGDMCNQASDTVGLDGSTGCDAGTTGCYTVQQIFSHVVWSADPAHQPNVPACIATRHDPNDYSIALVPNTASITLGGAPVSIPIVTTVTNGSALPLLLAVTDSPAGLVASIDARSIDAGETAHLVLSVDAGALPVQDGVVVVRATATTVHSASLLVQLLVPTNDWSLTIGPDAGTLLPGTSQGFTVSGRVTSGVPEPVTLDAAVSGLPAGVTAAFSAPSIVPGSSVATLTLTASPTAPAAAPTAFAVHGSSLSQDAGHVATGEIQVDSLPTVSITSPAAGTALSGTVGIAVSAAAGMNSSIASITVAVDSAAPLASGTGQNVSWDTRTVSNGSHLIQVKVVDQDGGQASTSIQVTVANVVDDFALSLSPSSQALPAGGSVAFDVISTVAAGNAEPISLSVSGLPQGVQMNVQPSTLAAGNTAILTLSASANTAARAAATFTVLGTSPSQPAGHTATATVSVTAARSDGGSGGGPGGTSSSSSGCSTTGGAAPPEGLLVLLGAALGLRARARPKVPAEGAAEGARGFSD